VIRVCRSIGVQYALEGVAALRLGEAVGLRWRPYDTAKEPLGQLLILTSYNNGRTKTGRAPPAGASDARRGAGRVEDAWMAGDDGSPSDRRRLARSAAV